MHINVINDYTYTLETIVQAGRDKIAVTSVPVRTNPALRPSRLFHGIWSYVKKSVVIILRAYMMYQPLKCFTYLSCIPLILGFGIGLRFLWLIAAGQGYGHVQSLILACTLIIIGFLTFMIGLVSDLMSANRRILTDTQYHIRRMEYEMLAEENAREWERGWEPYVVPDNGAAQAEKEIKHKIYNMC